MPTDLFPEFHYCLHSASTPSGHVKRAETMLWLALESRTGSLVLGFQALSCTGRAACSRPFCFSRLNWTIAVPSFDYLSSLERLRLCLALRAARWVWFSDPICRSPERSTASHCLLVCVRLIGRQTSNDRQAGCNPRGFLCSGRSQGYTGPATAIATFMSKVGLWTNTRG